MGCFGHYVHLPWTSLEGGDDPEGAVETLVSLTKVRHVFVASDRYQDDSGQEVKNEVKTCLAFHFKRNMWRKRNQLVHVFIVSFITWCVICFA